MANIIQSPASGTGLTGRRRMRTEGDNSEITSAFWLSFTLMTLISIGAGVLLATQVADHTRTRVLAEVEAQREQFPEGASYPENARFKKLDPIVTNLSAPADAFVRIQASVVFSEAVEPTQMDVLSSRIEEDIIAFLRTLTITHLEGGVALQHLREDLNERARIRSEGHVEELILESMVIQ
ncbi:flagellar protein [Roseibium aquae]|uniref:Flagellar protein FliL n=1 Tax=Roseibium aquae TaxID=1323746 RepID=A0A916TMW3_9HYPH|nr:flagellar basal body-associated FliL family protein [Roseibium aquae]GGB60100.1 flagellar protein [Roseibium aquae]